MVDYLSFKKWLEEHKDYSKDTVKDIVSRIKRADSIHEWFPEPVYIFELEQEVLFQSMSCSVRSQLRHAVKLYNEFYTDIKGV